MESQKITDINNRRPHHEKAHNREREKDCIAMVAKCSAVANHTLFPEGHHIDATFYNSDKSVRCFIEHRSRNIKITDYGDIPMTLSKYTFGLIWAKQYSVPFIIIWDLNDGIFVKKVPTGLKAEFFHGNKGEKDRGDPYDKEPCVMIPTKGAVKIIGERK